MAVAELRMLHYYHSLACFYIGNLRRAPIGGQSSGLSRKYFFNCQHRRWPYEWLFYDRHRTQDIRFSISERGTRMPIVVARQTRPRNALSAIGKIWCDKTCLCSSLSFSEGDIVVKRLAWSSHNHQLAQRLSLMRMPLKFYTISMKIVSFDIFSMMKCSSIFSLIAMSFSYLQSSKYIAFIFIWANFLWDDDDMSPLGGIFCRAWRWASASCYCAMCIWLAGISAKISIR